MYQRKTTIEDGPQTGANLRMMSSVSIREPPKGKSQKAKGKSQKKGTLASSNFSFFLRAARFLLCLVFIVGQAFRPARRSIPSWFFCGAIS
jgi:hypothetical protein